MEYNLADLWELVVATVPDRAAVVDGERRFTFLELDERANRLAHHLLGAGIGQGDHVALYLHNCVEYLEGMLAAFKIRAVPINVNYRYVADELRYLFCDADVAAVVHHAEFSDRIDTVRTDVPTLRHVLAVDEKYDATLAVQSSANDFGPRSEDDHYILYTGGTTGLPKGVIWRHVDLFFAALGGGGNGQDPIEQPEELAQRCQHGRMRCLAACPFMHGSAHWMALSALLTGGCVIVLDTHHFDAETLFDLAERERANFVMIVGDAYARPMVDALRVAAAPDDGTGGDTRRDLDGLRVIVSGGAVLSPTVKHELVDLLPEVIVVDSYGASETGGQGQSVTALGSPLAPTGFHLDDTTEILDDDLHAVGVGVVGRLARRGHIPLGYYNDPVKTAETFPHSDGERWAVPGDHAIREENGTITLLGRGSLCINTGGEKVYPDEVESQLKAHESVFDALVVGVADARFGERVVAVVQPRDDHDLDPDAVRTHLGAHLAGYKIPRSFVVVDHIVRSPSGKADYRWAAEHATRTLGV